MEQHTDVVVRVKADLVARGRSLLGPCGAFAITCRVAMDPAVRAEGWGLVAKLPGQNGCTVGGQRYAIDALMLKDGTTIDCLVKGGGDEDVPLAAREGTGNGPAWQPTGPSLPSQWRPPFDLDAVEIPDPVEPEPVEPEPLPTAEDDEKESLLLLVAGALTDVSLALAASDGKLDRIEATLARIEATQARGVGGRLAVNLDLRPPAGPKRLDAVGTTGGKASTEISQ